MPLAKTPILQIDQMAEGDNNKHILFNTALVALEDAANRALSIDLTSTGATLSETQMTRYGVYICSGHTVARTLTLPSTVGAGSPTNRIFAVRNLGDGAVTVRHPTGLTVVVPVSETGLLYADGTDIVSLGGVANKPTLPISKDGVEVEGQPDGLNFTGSGVTVTTSAGVVTIDIGTGAITFAGLSDVPAYTGNAGLYPRVNGTEDGIEFADPTMTDAAVKAAYEANADTNAFTDAEKSKLAGLESSTFKGTYLTDVALTSAHPAPEAGSYAYVDAGAAADVIIYIWDESDSAWVQGGSAESTETSATIKAKYEANADTNAFTDAEKTKLAGIETGAEVNQTGAEIVTALNSELGGAGWQSGGGIADAPTDGESYVRKDGAWVVGDSILPAFGAPQAGMALRVNGTGDGVLWINDVELPSYDTPEIGKVLKVGAGAVLEWATDAGASLPAYTTNAGKFLRVNSGETAAEWADAIPPTAGHARKVLEVLDDGSAAAWRRPGRIDVILLTDVGYTLDEDNIGAYIRITSATGQNITVPLDATTYLPTGSVFTFRQGGAGQLTVSPEVGVTVRSAKSLISRADESTMVLTKVADNAWDLTGDMEDV